MSTVSMCLAAHNAVSAVQLMWESFLKHHGSGAVYLLAHDNCSTDGAREFLEGHATVMTGGVDLFHGRALNRICAEVVTPYTLVCDTDLEFHAPVVHRIVAELEADPEVGCVCYPSGAGKADLGTCELDGVTYVSQLRIDPCLAVFRTPDLKRWTADTKDGVGWDEAREPGAGRFFDAGARLREAMEADGYRLAEPAWLWDAVTHFGGVATMWHDAEQGPEHAARLAAVQAARRERYALIKRRLRLLHNLDWNPPCVSTTSSSAPA